MPATFSGDVATFPVGSTVVYRQLIITIFRMPIYPMLNKANDPEYWLLIGRESGQVSHEY